MMLTYRYGLALSTSSPASRDAYIEACDLVLTLYPVVGDAAAAEARAQAIDEMVRAGRYSAGPTVPALARAFAAFQCHDFSAAIDAIEPVFSERERICGSRAQLDLVEFTLLKAYLAAGRRDDASRLVQARRPGPRAITVAGLDAAIN
jgi:hypothetical protein